MNLQIESLQFRGMFRHSAIGMGTMFLSHGVILSRIENAKTRVQLQEPGIPLLKSSNPVYDSSMSFLKHTGQMLSKVIGTNLVDQKLFKGHLPIFFQGLAGTLIGTLLVHPLDTIRVSTAVNRRRRGEDLYRGLTLALVIDCSAQVMAKTLSESSYLSAAVSKVSFGFLDYTLQSRVEWFLCLAAAKIILTPFEVVKKRRQTQSKSFRDDKNFVSEVVDLARQEGMEGLFRGWWIAIPEAFVIVVGSHLIHKGLVRLIGE